MRGREGRGGRGWAWGFDWFACLCLSLFVCLCMRESDLRLLFVMLEVVDLLSRGLGSRVDGGVV